MDKNCAAAILSTFEAAYPAIYAKQSAEVKRTAIMLFEQILTSFDNELVKAAAMSWIADKNTFPPSPGELRAGCEELDKAIALVSAIGREALDNNSRIPQVQAYIAKAAKERNRRLAEKRQSAIQSKADNFDATPRDLSALVE